MAMKRFVHHVMSNFCYKEPKKDVEDDEQQLVTSVEYRRQKVSVVSVGGIVKLYAAPIAAYLVMEKHPGLCLARPQIFNDPYKSIVGPRETLLPGQKLYLVPHSTVKKLQRNASKKLPKPVIRSAAVKEGGEGPSEAASNCRARDFYDSKEKWTRCSTKKSGILEEQHRQRPTQFSAYRRDRLMLGEVSAEDVYLRSQFSSPAYSPATTVAVEASDADAAAESSSSLGF